MRRIPALALLALLHLPPALAAGELSGEVVGVTDGDTLTLLTPDHRQTRVRLADIDTPERGQPYGSRAREALGVLAFRRQVRVLVEDTDRYGRSVGRVYAGAADVNAEMVRRGAAWVYPKYNRDPALPGLEAEARAARRGLWGLPEAERTPPWEWRLARRGEAPLATRPAATAAPGGFTCGTKTYCREMTSCAEAMFHLRQCGPIRLDADRDGVPCESICR